MNGPPARFMVETAFLNPVSGHEGFATTSSAPLTTFLGTYSSFPGGLGLFTKFFPAEDHVELRYIHSTSLPFRMGVTDRATGRAAFFRNAENECGDSARDTFVVTDAPVGKCRSYRRGRRDPSVGCFLGNRFQVELTWTDPGTGRRGKGRLHVGGVPYSHGTVGFKNNAHDWQVILRFALAATTILLGGDDELADRAEAIVVARVVASTAASDLPATEHRIAVSQVLKGRVEPEAVVRVPGGDAPGGLHLR